MDANFEIVLEELKRRFKNQESLSTSADNEERIREFKTELYLKRDEVMKLRNDLESATSEINELKKALNTVTRSSDENAFNYNTISKKYNSMMNELMKKRDLYTKLQMQHEMTIAENDILKEKLQENETERSELARKVESFEAKQRHDFIYQKEILKKHSNSKILMEEINDMVMKLKAEQVEVLGLAAKSKLAEVATEKLQILSHNHEKLKAEKCALEQLYIKTNAKCETFEELMNTRKEIHEPDLKTKIIYQYWRSNRESYRKQIMEKEKVLLQLNESYVSEKSANIQLIYRNEAMNRKIEELYVEINRFKSIEMSKHSEVKTETIEIQD